MTLRKNEDLLAGTKRYRADADALRKRLKVLAKAPITQAMAKERMRAEVEQYAQRRPSVASPIEGRQDHLANVEHANAAFSTSSSAQP